LGHIERYRGARDVLTFSNGDEYPKLLQRHVFCPFPGRTVFRIVVAVRAEQTFSNRRFVP
jgi:hypothetical protein